MEIDSYPGISKQLKKGAQHCIVVNDAVEKESVLMAYSPTDSQKENEVEFRLEVEQYSKIESDSYKAKCKEASDIHLVEVNEKRADHEINSVLMEYSPNDSGNKVDFDLEMEENFNIQCSHQAKCQEISDTYFVKIKENYYEDGVDPELYSVPVKLFSSDSGENTGTETDNNQEASHEQFNGSTEHMGETVNDGINSSEEKHEGIVEDLKKTRFQCETCKFQTKYFCLLKYHLCEFHKKRVPKGANMKNLKCKICNFRTHTQEKLEEHISSMHVNEPKFTCHLCEYKTMHKGFFDRHLSLVHLDKLEVQCHLCEYKTVHKSRLNAHITCMHLNDGNFKCHMCDFKTNHKGSLGSHISCVHLNERTFQCHLCEYKAKQKELLKKHIYCVHLNERKMKCHLCKFRTNVKSSLLTHVSSVHLKERKLKCNICEFKTNHKSTLRLHISSIHLDERKFECHLCEYKANQKVSVRKHIASVHLN